MRKGERINDLWYKNLFAFRDFMLKTGSLPNLYAEDVEERRLATWVRYQRVFMQRGELAQEYLNALNTCTPQWNMHQTDFKRNLKESAFENSVFPEFLNRYPCFNNIDMRLIARSCNYNITNIQDTEQLRKLLRTRLDLFKGCVYCFTHSIEVSAEELDFLLCLYNVTTVQELNVNFECVSQSLCEVFKFLDAQQLFIIKSRFFDNKCLREVGEEMGVSRERIRQLETKILQSLRTKQIFLLLQYGRERYANEYCQTQNAIRKVAEVKAERVALLDSGRISKGLYMKDIELCELNLSTRTHNCLIRAGIHNLYDLLETPVERLLETRNFGQRCYTEVIQIQHKFKNLSM